MNDTYKRVVFCSLKLENSPSQLENLQKFSTYFQELCIAF
jgi:hypothetical protein